MFFNQLLFNYLVLKFEVAVTELSKNMRVFYYHKMRLHFNSYLKIENVFITIFIYISSFE